MKYLLLPLRVSIPAILLMMGCVAGAFSYQRQISLTRERVKDEITQQAKQMATATAQLLDYLYRRTDLQDSQTEGVTLMISRLSGDLNLNMVLFVDDQNRIRNASRYTLQNQQLQNTPWVSLLPVVEAVRRDRAGQVVSDGQNVSAVYPVTFPPRPGELRSTRVGAIILDYDLQRAQQPEIADAINQSLQNLLILGILCVLVVFLLDRMISARARKLVFVSNQLAEGNFHARVRLNGLDELAQISRAFNAMADQIQYKTEALQASEKYLTDKTEDLERILHELNQTQLQLVQQEKMSSLGQLVAGVAHEINNPVNFIHGNLPHVQTYTQDILGLVNLYQQHYPNPVADIQEEIEAIDLEFLQEDIRKIIASMQVGTDRIRQIVLSLRNFSRMDEAEFKEVDLHEGLESTLLILQHRLKAKPERPEIKVERDYAPLPKVACYGGQLNQVFMNILVNALDALEEKLDQEVALADRTRPFQPMITIRTGTLPGNWIKIAIADNGPGIPDHVKSRIFDPFYTTKPIGKGTGMGMSISYQIITEKHRGQLKCFSTLGQCTEFVIELPIHQARPKSS